MKVIILLSIPFIIFASGETLTKGEHNSLHASPTRKASIKMKKERQQLHNLHKVEEEQARTIAKKETKEEVTSLRLTHNKEYLFYEVSTEHYDLRINALDGLVMQKLKSK